MDRLVQSSQGRLRAYDGRLQDDVKRLQECTRLASKEAALRRFQSSIPATERKQHVRQVNSAIALLAMPSPPRAAPVLGWGGGRGGGGDVRGGDARGSSEAAGDSHIKREAMAAVARDCVRREAAARRRLVAKREEEVLARQQAALASVQRAATREISMRSTYEANELERVRALDMRRRVTARGEQRAEREAERTWLAAQKEHAAAHREAITASRVAQRTAAIKEREVAAERDTKAKAEAAAAAAAAKRDAEERRQRADHAEWARRAETVQRRGASELARLEAEYGWQLRMVRREETRSTPQAALGVARAALASLEKRMHRLKQRIDMADAWPRPMNGLVHADPEKVDQAGAGAQPYVV